MKVKVGDFVKITKRKCSDKVQPYIHLGSVYNVHKMDKTSKGTTVLIFLRADTPGATVRCNADRFEWKIVDIKDVAREYIQKKGEAAKVMREAAENARFERETAELFSKFTEDEQGRFSQVPQMIYDIAWSFGDKVAKYAADHRIEILKGLTRSYKMLRQSYRDFLKSEFSSEQLRLVDGNVQRFLDEHQIDFTLMFYSVINSINHQYQDVMYDDMRANAFICKLMVRILFEFEKEIYQMVKSRFKQAEEIHFKFEDELIAIMNAYIGDYNFTISREVEIAINVFKKNIRSLEFINQYD